VGKSLRQRIAEAEAKVSVTLPLEDRQETRVEHGHTYSQWKFKLHWYNYRCAYCGIAARDTPEGYLTRDHIIPISEGGDDDIDNIVPACKQCNKTKGSDMPGTSMSYPRVRQRRSPHG
jgi:5-methylcytosine-specific restriction endonuclease McrA